MSALDPSGPSQPTQAQAYTTPGNPSTKNPSETAQTASNADDASDKVDRRIPTTQAPDSQATASSLGRGIHGAPAGEEGKGLTEEDVGRHNELDGEQMAAPGEGKVADAVAGRGGDGNVGGEQADLAADLDR
ncbi:hypothetical protein K505DRAFT_329153 [Melanomma pulvis-pyrius CBS 109.77]|uniref:Uncharacterized protein n=1 Tax=Melanomma pulvis-pyrius CBS 109.77 TaxID=1314802 RepID=A0A6A6WW48_9PLEO|nr:hypothetical protein K505DRAFT_329153 [Melanomma pulvis-pyrius CBS 109.77]